MLLIVDTTLAIRDKIIMNFLYEDSTIPMDPLVPYNDNYLKKNH